MKKKIAIKPMDLIFIGGIIIVVGTIVAAIGTRMQNRANSIKSEENVRLQNEINNLITGKDSRPIIGLELPGGDEMKLGVYKLYIYNDGNYPVTDIKIYFNDFYNADEQKKIAKGADAKKYATLFQSSLAQGEHYKKVIEIGSLGKGALRDDVYNFIILQTDFPLLNFYLKVVWKDGSYTASGWFKNPKLYSRNQLPPDSVLGMDPAYSKKIMNTFLFWDDIKGRFEPNPYRRY